MATKKYMSLERMAEYDALIKGKIDEEANKKADKNHTHDIYETKEDAQVKYDEITNAKADWNQNNESSIDYIKNKPFGEDTQYTVEVEELTINCDTADGNGYYATIKNEYEQVDLLLNSYPDTKAFLFDGTMYDVETNVASYGNRQYIYCGNAYLMGITDEDNGLPFCVRVIIDDYVQVVGINVYTRTQGNHTIALYAKSSVVKTIDEKYLPDSVKNENIVQLQSDWNQNDEWSDDYIKNKPFYEEIIETGEVETIYDDELNSSVGIIGIDLYTGEIYCDILYVDFDGVTYKVIKVEDSPVRFLWHFESAEGIDLPFKLEADELDYNVYVYFDESTSHTLVIKRPVTEKFIHQLNEKYIPDSVVKKDYLTQQLDSSKSDWNQSDESSADYIKNKPFYEEIVETGEATEVYNGSVTDSIMLDVITYDFGFGEMLYVTFDGVKYKLYGHRSGIICSYTSNEGDIPFYVSHDMLDQVLNFSCKDSGTHMVLIEIPVIEKNIVQLDEKFIPDTIARSYELEPLRNGLNYHSHDDKYYTEEEIDNKISDINASIDNITGGTTVVKEAKHATTADSATNATNANHAVSADSATTATTASSATKATQDGNGKVISSTYETKTDASAKLTEAKSYTDTKVSGMATTTVVDNKISSHNTSATAHSDIRDLISALSTKVNNFLDVDDTTTDELSEVLALINNNKGTLESLTSSKVNVSDIVDNLTTSNASKVLSAKQGVALKALIDALQEAVDGKAASGHGHAISEITNLQTTLNAKASQSDLDALEDVVSGKANATHSHAIADVTGLQSALDGKAASSHGTHVTYSTTAPLMDGTASAGSAATVARSDHKHPTDTSRASKTEFDTHTANTTVHITSTERTNWGTAYTHSQAAHAPSNAQANVIESIKVNGAAQTISSKAVNITVPTKASDINAADASHGHSISEITNLQTTLNNASSAIGANTSSITALTDRTSALEGKVGDGFTEITSAEISALFAK